MHPTNQRVSQKIKDAIRPFMDQKEYGFLRYTRRGYPPGFTLDAYGGIKARAIYSLTFNRHLWVTEDIIMSGIEFEDDSVAFYEGNSLYEGIDSGEFHGIAMLRLDLGIMTSSLGNDRHRIRAGDEAIEYFLGKVNEIPQQRLWNINMWVPNENLDDPLYSLYFDNRGIPLEQLVDEEGKPILDERDNPVKTLFDLHTEEEIKLITRLYNEWLSKNK